jgi:tRNA(fMet)-specific endonuclease VapC
MLFLPDTNALSRYLQGRDDALVARVAAEFPNLRIAAIVVAELEYGAAKSGIARHRQRLDSLLAVLAVESFSLADAQFYGGLRADLERRGQCIGPHDMLIAAQALRLGATVVTHNTREFSRVPGLKCEDWQSA